MRLAFILLSSAANASAAYNHLPRRQEPAVTTSSNGASSTEEPRKLCGAAGRGNGIRNCPEGYYCAPFEGNPGSPYLSGLCKPGKAPRPRFPNGSLQPGKATSFADEPQVQQQQQQQAQQQQQQQAQQQQQQTPPPQSTSTPAPLPPVKRQDCGYTGRNSPPNQPCPQTEWCAPFPGGAGSPTLTGECIPREGHFWSDGKQKCGSVKESVYRGCGYMTICALKADTPKCDLEKDLQCGGECVKHPSIVGW